MLNVTFLTENKRLLPIDNCINRDTWSLLSLNLQGTHLHVSERTIPCEDPEYIARRCQIPITFLDFFSFGIALK